MIKIFINTFVILKLIQSADLLHLSQLSNVQFSKITFLYELCHKLPAWLHHIEANFYELYHKVNDQTFHETLLWSYNYQHTTSGTCTFQVLFFIS
uniref:Secreted protein n=1 Tax=Ciona intestinalis TaxID=7719 RepID=H2XPH7_CIOIN